MARKLPDNLSDYSGFARYTIDSWRDLDNFYNYWTRRWRKTLDYIRGDHWRALQEYARDELPAWKRYPVINYTNTIYNEYLRQYLEGNVRYSAVPESPEPTDVAGAELVEQIMKYTWDVLDMESKRPNLASWVISCGTGYLRFYWDTNTGDMLPLAVPTPDGGLLPVNPDTLQADPTLTQPLMVDKGEIGVEVLSPQFVRWGTTEADGCMVGLLLNRMEAESMYGVDATKKLSFKTGHTSLHTDLNLGDSPVLESPTEEKALVIQHYLPPSAKYPNGLWWTASESGSKLLTAPNALPAGIIPIATFRWIPVPGHRKLGMSPLYDLTFINKSYDERMAKILEWQGKVLPKYLLMSGGGITYGEINDEPGQELVVNAGAEPKVMEFRQPPNSFFTMLQTDLQDMLGVGGFSFGPAQEPSPGDIIPGARIRVPEKPKPGAQVQVAHLNAKAGWQEAGEVVVGYVANFYEEPRVIQIQGPDKSYQWQEFRGTDLNNVATTLRVDETALIPETRKQLRDTVIALMGTDFGQFLIAGPDGQPDGDRLNAILNAAGVDVDLGAVDPDTLEARNENAAFKAFDGRTDPALLPQIQEWQEDPTHYEEHIRVLKSKRYQSWPEPGKQALLQHVQGHAERMNQAAQAERDAFLQQEQALRQIRAQTDTQGKIREMGAETVFEIIKPLIENMLAEAGVLPEQDSDTES